MLDYRNRKNKNYWWLAVFTILIACLLFVWGSFGRSLFSGSLAFFTKPLWQASDNLGTVAANQLSGLGQSRSALLAENKNLREENRKLKNSLLAQNSIIADNVRLRSIFGRNQNSIKPVVARVIFLPNFVPYNNLLLDIGKNNRSRSFQVGDLVVADGTILIGRVAEIDDTYTKVRLISAEANLSVTIGVKNVPAIASGSGVGNFTITLPKDTPVFEGDRVTTPSLGNYLIGSVGHIEKMASRPTQTILVRTPVNLWQLKWLEIYDTKT
ncbi:MAG: rod shape-determining protein MreC [Candidatus Paceibacterota bacterium]|jgi:cell shape-determining protein MreC